MCIFFSVFFKQEWWCLDTHLFGEPEETWFLSVTSNISDNFGSLMSGFHLKRIFQRFVFLLKLSLGKCYGDLLLLLWLVTKKIHEDLSHRTTKLRSSFMFSFGFLWEFLTPPKKTGIPSPEKWTNCFCFKIKGGGQTNTLYVFTSLQFLWVDFWYFANAERNFPCFCFFFS